MRNRVAKEAPYVSLNDENSDYSGQEGTYGFVANFAQEVMKGQLPCLWRGLGGQGVEQFGRSEAFVFLFDYQLPLLDHVHEFYTNQCVLGCCK
jgi:hypothetical protein